MARINVEEKWWTDSRRSALIKALGGDEERADGSVVRLWRLAQEYWKKNREGIPKHCFDVLPCASELLRCALVSVRDTSVFVRGASEHFEWMDKKRLAASAGGKKSAETRRKKYGSSQPKHRSTPEAPSNEIQPDFEADRSTSNCLEPSLSFSLSSSPSNSNSKSEIKEEVNKREKALWQIYEERWEQKYHAKPVRNAKINSQLKQLESRIPEEDQAQLIQFYLSHTKPYYVQSMHTVGALLSDCETLVAQMRTGTSFANGIHAVSKVHATNQRNDELMQKRLALLGEQS